MKDLEEVIAGNDIRTMEEALRETEDTKEENTSAEDVCEETAQEVAAMAPEPVETMEDYAEELEASFRRFAVGDILTGTVIDVDETGVLMDFNYYAPGRIAAEDMSADPHFNLLEQVKIGDTITATVVKTDDGAGNLVLSRREADHVLAWEKLAEMKEAHTVVEGIVSEVVPSGAILYVEGVRGFIPASRLALQYVENTEEYLGQKVRVQVLEVDEESEKLILSARELLTEAAIALKNEKVSRMEEGAVVEGTVEKLMPYGAFVSIGDGISGLLHVSEISEKRIRHPKVVLSVGQKVRVKITKISDGKISLSMKALEDVLNKEVQEDDFEYREEGQASTSLGALLAGLKL